MKRLLVLLGALVAMALVAPVLTSCGGGGGGGQEFTVTAVEYKFTPADLTVKSGQQVTVTLQNKGTVAHNWTVLNLEGQGKNVTTGDVSPGQSKSVEFTPSKAGQYQIECTVPGHAQLGMKGTLTVQ